MSRDREFMSRALALAARGLYTTTPNPRVGAVLVRDGRIIAEGFHEKAGGPHAEVMALHGAKAVEGAARGADLYVTLEPCSHQGRTPPCTAALIEAGVKRVVAAMQDPNPQVAGSGFARLREAGIAVASGIMESEARELNIGFVSRMTRGRPWVRMKVAASLDGRTALANRKSQWITGEAARTDGHAWRARACAVLTGFGTVRDDDPQLTVRMVRTPRQPLRVLIDSRLETPPAAKLFDKGADGGGVLVFAGRDEVARRHALEARGAEVVVLPNAEGKVNLPSMLAELARRGVNELHVEAGTRLNGSLLEEGCVDELLIYLAPRLIGGTGLGMFDLSGMTELAQTPMLRMGEITRVGEDVRILARIRK